MRNLAAALAFLITARAAAPGARAQEHVPLGENFGDAEVVEIFVLTAADLVGLAVQGPVVEARDPLMGDPWHWDRRVSEQLYRGPGAGRWLGGAPDVTGLVIAPALTFGVYGADGFAAFFGHPIWGRHADHELLALVEAYAVTLGLTQAAKLGIGRLRPEYALERVTTPPEDDDEATLSFFSGHSSSSFCLAAYLSRDIGDSFVKSGAHPVLARLVPSVVLYGAASVIALSRVIDQKHYLTDVGVGAIVGASAGNLFYALHFDGEGQPRRRYPGRVGLLAFPGGLGITGRF